ncbi:SHOCT domain-containing protein [Saccharopolyspora sp. TS4A08]|uniref:SHOCT domain-containing protein n=1 Tax=Saccharopolyspora ipomoeae TaxID=3042027 RepID=A0ABT6PVC6_9PSEU|nr:SHOCT domain-containing protein [Saccharopolyspora sp. TS4A08]MDI2031822.1 SHOCT domain-containing protein [Saccharopolyspora sp. TS4A08]
MVTELLMQWGPGGPGPGGHGGGPFWIFGLVWMVLIAALIGTVIYALLRKTRRPSATESARTILAERYARGELTGEEYRERLGELR